MFYTFDLKLRKKNAHRFEKDFDVEILYLRLLLLDERIHNPVTVTRIAFKEKKL